MEGFFIIQKGKAMYSLKRVLEIALSGKHNCIFFGSVDLMPITIEKFFIACCLPCKCGRFFRGACTCSDLDIQYTLANIPSRQLNLSDMYVPINDLRQDVDCERINAVHRMQERRYRNNKSKYNGNLSRNGFEKYCRMDFEAQEFLKDAQKFFKCSMTDMDKVVRVARTIADLEFRETISRFDVAEALGYVSCYLHLKRRIV